MVITLPITRDTVKAMPYLIILTGHSCTGKTSIAKKLSTILGIAYVSKDALKDRIFDGLGHQDKAWSHKVSATSHRIMDDFIQQELRLGRSIIVESNFKHEIDSTRFANILSEYGADCLQILCEADGALLFKRWNDRIVSGERHAGHVEEISLEDLRKDFLNPYKPLELPGDLARLDTTEFSTVPTKLEEIIATHLQE